MLRMLRERVKGLFSRAPAAEQAGGGFRMRKAFALRYCDVLKACISLQEATELPSGQFACRYMNSIMQQNQESWWQENAPYLTQPWFVYEYACDQQLIQRKPPSAEECPEQYIVAPEKPLHQGAVRLQAERTVGNPERGSIHMHYDFADKTYRWIARTHHFHTVDHQYIRTIGEADGGVCDRVVETAMILLEYGYRVCVDEASLHRRIMAEDFVPAYPYWVLEGTAIDRLELRYPRDKVLHGHVYQAGGRWNGSTVEISICNAHLLDDLIRLYGFRITEKARQRMAAWQNALGSATVYRPRQKRGEAPALPAIDRFREMMERKPSILEDLCDNNE